MTYQQELPMDAEKKSHGVRYLNGYRRWCIATVAVCHGSRWAVDEVGGRDHGVQLDRKAVCEATDKAMSGVLMMTNYSFVG